MKIILFMLLFIGNTASEKPIMKEVRKLYQNATEEEKACQELIEILAPYTENESALLYGYKASATVLMAKHVFNPVSKLDYFNKGKKMLEQAISAKPNNIELRLLRFHIQSNIPFFLGYRNHLEMDKNFILNNISKIQNTDLKKYIVSSLEGSKSLSEDEMQTLKKTKTIKALSFIKCCP